MNDFVRHHIEKHGALFNSYFASEPEGIIFAAAESIAECFLSGGKLYLCGSGLSGHMARYAANLFVHHHAGARPPLPAIAINSDISLLNLKDPDDIFEKQLTALATAGDLVWGLSASGNCESIVRGLRAVSMQGIKTISTVGQACATAKGVSDIYIEIDDKDILLVQELHVMLVHMISQLVEKIIFEPSFKTD